jgi:predicted nucleic acid-binding protein
VGISAITLGELRLGALQAKDPEVASRRLSAYQLAQRFDAISVDEAVFEAWALLVSRLRAAGQKIPINDSWIAATAIAHRIPIVTQDSDYDAMPDVQVIRFDEVTRAPASAHGVTATTASTSCSEGMSRGW